MALFALLLGGLGVLCLFGGAQTLREARGFRSRARRAPGTLVAIHADRHNDHPTTYPVLRFRTAEGTDVQTTSNVNEGPFYLTRMRGRQVPVLPAQVAVDGQPRPRHAMTVVAQRRDQLGIEESVVGHGRSISRRGA